MGSRMPFSVAALLLAKIALLLINWQRLLTATRSLLFSVPLIYAISFIITSSELSFLKGFSFALELYRHFIDSASSPTDIFRSLDPVRYAEHQLFFSRQYSEIFFGSGFGAGLFDHEGYLNRSK